MLHMQQGLVYYPHTMVPDITYKSIGGPGNLRALRNCSIFVIPDLELLLNEHLDGLDEYVYDDAAWYIALPRSDKARRLLAKPIKFFNEMRELFVGSNANGSLAMDQNTCMDADDSSNSDDSRELFDFNAYTQPEEVEGEDSNTLPTPTRHATIDNTSSSTTQASRKRPRAKNSPTKKPKRKSRFADSIDEITATMKSLRETLAATAPPQMPQLSDPHAALWERLEAIPMTSDQRVLVGEHLSTKENKGKRGWLCNASADTLHAWVFKFLCEKEGINL